MATVRSAPKVIWRKLRGLVSLIHGYDDVRQVYGDNPNNLSEEQRTVARAVTSNGVNVGQSGW